MRNTVPQAPNPGPNFQLDLNPERRREFIATCNEKIKEARERLFRNSRKQGGLAGCSRFAEEIDEVLRLIHDWLINEARLKDEDHERIAVVAQGGYGRGQLNPFSDVDLLFLLPDSPRPVEHAFIKSFLYVLWDLNKIELGHATKSVAEALSSVGFDLDSTTALIETRLVAGSIKMLDELRTRFTGIVRGSARKWFIESKIAEQKNRHEKYGSSIYLLEPNVKEGEGALRDVHSLQWLSCVLLGSSRLTILVEKDVLTASELEAIEKATDFLLKVRTFLHESEGRKVDTLSFDKQPSVAQALGYKSDKELLAEERMMKDYYLHARSINRYGQKATRILTVRARSLIGGMFEAIQRRKINDNYYVKSGVLFHKRPDSDFFKKEPWRVMECFYIAAKTRVFMSEELKDQICNAHEYTDTDEFRSSDKCRHLFMKILGRKKCVAQTMHAMHDTGVLADYMPEFRKLFCLVRIDHYHRYTVDEHLIKTIEVSEALINEAPGQRAELIQAAREIERWDVLNLALLLHDIGKGEGHGHVLRGGIISQKMTQRMGLAPEEQETVRQLILLHLKMNHVSQRRDLDDPHVIAEMAATVGNIRLLRMLYILTYCDTKAVGPSAWTDWKAALLFELYAKTQMALEGKDPMSSMDEKARTRLLDRLQQKLENKLSRQEIEQFISNVPPKYLTSFTPSRMAKHMLMLKQISPETRVVWELDEPEHMNYTELTAVSNDVKGFMSYVCGALSSKDINILSVQAFSTKDGFAIDTFQVTDLRGNKLPHGFRLDRLRTDLNAVLTGKANANDVFVSRKPRRRLREDVVALKPSQILLDNDSSPSYTIMEVKTYDRPGLLYDITRTFTQEGYYIHLALISTEAYRVVDVFYITDLEFNKLEMNQIKRLQTKLEEAII